MAVYRGYVVKINPVEGSLWYDHFLYTARLGEPPAISQLKAGRIYLPSGWVITPKKDANFTTFDFYAEALNLDRGVLISDSVDDYVPIKICWKNIIDSAGHPQELYRLLIATKTDGTPTHYLPEAENDFKFPSRIKYVAIDY